MADRWTIHEADSREFLPTIDAVDHVITDPPYEAEAHTLQRRSISVVDPAQKQVLHVAPLPFEPIDEATRRVVALELARLSRRWTLVFCQVEAAMRWRDALVGDEHGVNGVSYRRTCVWTKPDGQPQLSGDRPGMGYESIVCVHRTGRSRWNGGGALGVFEFNKGDGGGKKNEHPTTKPLSLMLELVRLFTDPDDLILDPFAGSGTTGVACLRLGRRFIGIEKDPTYAALARERLEAESRGQTLQQLRAGQQTLFGKAGK